TQDIRIWYERDIPLHLHPKFFSIARAEEAYILGMVTVDMQWFRDKVAIALNVYVEWSPRLRGIQTELESQLKDKKVADTERLRLLSRVGSRTAMIAYYMLFLNPIGAAIGGAISVAAELISDLTINRKAEVQREE